MSFKESNLEKYKNYMTSECKLSNLQCDCQNYVCKDKETYYIQPEKAKKCPPIDSLCPNKKPMNCASVYQNSYKIPGKISPQINYKPTETFQFSNLSSCEKYTTTQIAYPPGVYSQPSNAIRPCNRNIIGTGTFQGATTQKLDYYLRPYSKRSICHISDGISLSDTPLKAISTTQSIYKLPRKFQKSTPCLPKSAIQINCGPMENETTHKAYYLRWPYCTRDNSHPWANKTNFQKSKIPFESETMYSRSYTQQNMSKLKQCKPTSQNIITSGTQFLDTSVYRAHYPSKNSQPAKSYAPKGTSVYFGNHQPEIVSSQKVSYPAWGDCKSAESKKPCDSKLIENAQIESITTQNHDYIPFPYSKRELIMPVNVLKPPDVPINTLTTTRVSYSGNTRTSKTQIFKPVQGLFVSEGKQDLNTIQRTDFIAWPSFPRLLGAKKRVYTKPSVPFHSSSTYQTNFALPGKLVEHKDCVQQCKCNYSNKCFKKPDE